ncbi:MAG: hypothetical protein J0I99_00720 [Devosia sp.]|uniref:hypothetical protein n=1 Tax=Devosia sp. TaxID=1871048 RepID=UPI001AC9E9DE|nr:hypothetical protein [Devosia sp.]MBN9308726.1 hypothetical protein [Devosia sp.]MBN9314240.1 hypothetical protein [Devosia sp.]
MSAFKRLDKMVSNAVDRVNKERFRWIPMRDSADPNGRRRADLDRAMRDDLWGIFDYTSAEYGLELGVRKSYREANDLRAVSVGRKPVISIDRKYFPDPLLEPRQGDLIEMLNDDGTPQADLPQFEVMDNQRDGQSRMELRLVQRGQQA